MKCKLKSDVQRTEGRQGCGRSWGSWDCLPACLPGKGLPVQLDPTLHPVGLSFGSGDAASSVQVLPTLGPASSTGGLCWGDVGVRWPHWPYSCRVPCAAAAGEPRRELLEQRAPGHSPVSHWAMLCHRPATALGTVRAARRGPRGCFPALPSTPKHLYLDSPQKGILQEHPGLAPAPKELTDRHRLGRTGGGQTRQGG